MPRVVVTPGFYIYLALCILILPLRWMTAWIVAAAVHEAGHIVAILLCNGKIRQIQLSAEGAVIDTDICGRKAECICTAAGPLFSFFVVLWICRFPLFGFFGLVQLIYNLLPFYPQDGGRVVNCILGHYLPRDRVERVLKFMQKICLFTIVVFGFVLSFVFHLGMLPFLFCVLFLIRGMKTNIPCKRNRLIVQ